MTATVQFPDAFDVATHTYTRNLAVVPGCSQILKEVGVVSMDGIPPHILERKARLGTAVAEYTVFVDNGTIDQYEIHPDCLPYVDCYIQAKSKIGWEWKEVEQFHVVDIGEHESGCREVYGVTPDRVGEFDGSPFVGVMEIKTTLKYPAYHQLQTAMQTACVTGKLFEHVPRAAIYLDKSGKFNPDKHFVRHTEHSRDLLAARQVVSVWYWRRFYGRAK